MAEFLVDPSELDDAALNLADLSPRVTEFQRRAKRHAHAAKGTRAAQGMLDLADHWAAVLPRFAAASGDLSTHLHLASSDYRAADQSVVRAVSGPLRS